MGLKYNFFIVKADPDDLLKRLVANGAVDETSLMLAEREWGKKMDDELRALKPATVEAVEKIMGRLRPPELQAYHDREYSERLHGFSIWWMRFPPDPSYIVGGYTSYRLVRWHFAAFTAAFITDGAGLKNVWFVNYHHGSNEGSIYLANGRGKDFDIKEFPALPEETERFEQHAARITKEQDVPITKLHDWISDEKTADPVPWTHAIRFPKRGGENK